MCKSHSRDKSEHSVVINCPMVLLFEDEQEAQNYRRENFGTLPKNVIYGIDRDGAIRRQIAQQMKLQSEREVVAVRERVEEAEAKAAAEGADVEEAAAAAENPCPENEEACS